MPRYDWNEVQRHYDAGHSIRECGDRFGFSSGALHHAVKRGKLCLEAGELQARPRGVTRGRVARLREAGLSQAEIAAQLRVAKSTVSFHIRRLGQPADPGLAKRYEWAEIRAYYDAGHSATECRHAFGFSVNAWADAVRRGAVIPRPRLEPLNQVLAAGRPRSRQHVKVRLLGAGLKQQVCERCGLTDWCGASLSFELHHVNGDGLDNRIENLELLCPNCHSQTGTWGARNKGRAASAGDDSGIRVS